MQDREIINLLLKFIHIWTCLYMREKPIQNFDKRKNFKTKNYKFVIVQLYVIFKYIFDDRENIYRFTREHIENLMHLCMNRLIRFIREKKLIWQIESNLSG